MLRLLTIVALLAAAAGVWNPVLGGGQLPLDSSLQLLIVGLSAGAAWAATS